MTSPSTKTSRLPMGRRFIHAHGRCSGNNLATNELPIRLVAERFGYVAEWDGPIGTVTIRL